MIALFSALEEEIRDLKKGMSVGKTSENQYCRVYEGRYNGRDNLLILTGMGKERAVKAVRFILEQFQLDAVISTGFGGALNEKTGAGDIVVYSKLTCEGNGTDSEEEALMCDSNLVSAASRSIDGNGFQSLLGNGVTVSKVCDTPQSKHKLGWRFSADVVDMESYWIGKIAIDRKVPFLTVRSIFDAAHDDLTILNHIADEGRVKPLKALGYFTCHPWQLRQTAHYMASYKKAGKNLAIFFYKMMREI